MRARHLVVELLIGGKRVHAERVLAERLEQRAFELGVAAGFVDGVAYLVVMVDDFPSAFAGFQQTFLLQIADNRQNDVAVLDVNLGHDTPADHALDRAFAQGTYGLGGIGIGAHGRPCAKIHESHVELAVFAAAFFSVVADVAGEVIGTLENRIPHLGSGDHIVDGLAERVLRGNPIGLLGCGFSVIAGQNEVAGGVSATIEVVASPTMAGLAVMTTH